MNEWVPQGLLWPVVLLWGAIWGSFANVVIARMPHKKSVVWPASHCIDCETPIRWHDNLPLISWLILRGRCRACGVRIPVRYPLVELGGVVCSVAAAWAAQGGVTAWRLVDTPPLEVLSVWMLLTLFFLILLMLTVIDVQHLLLPHRLTIPLAILAFVYAFVVPPGGDWRGFIPSISVRDAAIGFVIAYGGLFLFALIYAVLRGRQGMGGGDFMLFGALGAWFGAESLPMLMLLAALQGVLAYALAMMFFPSLIREVDPQDDAFWDGRTGDSDTEKTSVDREELSGRGVSSKAEALQQAGDPTPPKEGVRNHETMDADLAIGASGDVVRGVPFGPFLCLAAVEFVAFGGVYLQWLNGGV